MAISVIAIMLSSCAVAGYGPVKYQGINALPQASVTGTVQPTTLPSPMADEGPAKAIDAQLMDYGIVNKTVNRGENAVGFVLIKNTGDRVINEVNMSITLDREVPAVGKITLGDKDFTISGLNIQPGDTKKIEFSALIPNEFQGISTAGDYNLKATVYAGAKDIGTFEDTLRVV